MGKQKTNERSVPVTIETKSVYPELDHSYVLQLNTPAEEHSFTVSADSSDPTVLNLSRRNLKKVPKPEDAQNLRTLILDENDLQKVDNIDSFLKIETVSAFAADAMFR